MGNDKGQSIARKVVFTRRCEHSYRKLQDSIKRTVDRTISEIALNPSLGYPLEGQRLRGLYSIHCGDFRIVYKFRDNPDEIELWAIAHRSRVYEDLERFRAVSS